MVVSRVVIYGNKRVRTYDAKGVPIPMLQGHYEEVKYKLWFAINKCDPKIVVATKDDKRKQELTAKIDKDYLRLFVRPRQKTAKELVEEENQALEASAAMPPQ